MNAFLDKNYGADADGNRGIPNWEYEIEESDTEYILDQLKLFKDEFDPVVESIPEKVELPFLNPITEEDIFLEIKTDDFLEDLRVYKIVTKENFENFLNVLIKFDRDLALKLSLTLIEKLSQKVK